VINNKGPSQLIRTWSYIRDSYSDDSNMEIDQELLTSFCDETNDLLNRWEQICLEFSKKVDPALFQELFRIAHNIKGGSRAVGLMQFGDVVHKIEDGITLLRDNKVPLSEGVLGLLFESQKLLSDWVAMLRLDGAFKPDCADFLKKYLNGFEAGSSSIDSQADQIIEAAAVMGQNKTSPEAHSPVGSKAAAEAATNGSKKQKQSAKSSQINTSETIRISAYKLDQLIQSIGELSIHQSILKHTKNDIKQVRTFENSMQLSQKLTKDLYDKALSLRMQPLQSVFQRLERNIIDISKTLGKQVNVIVEGSEVELDKSVIEKIVDPLTHLVRNAIDHGVEMPEVRKANGKPEIGTVKLTADQDAFGVVITIKDDGKGIVAEKILNKAKEKGLIQDNQVLSKKEMINLIFLPGFSTAEKVTDVSGRGVGMDVVRIALEQLQGTITIDSDEGVGSSFVITLPTSVSIIDGMIVSICGENYVVPIQAVDEVISVNNMNQNLSQHMFKLRDQVIPVHDLSEILTHGKKSDSTHKTILLCKFMRDRVGLLVDRVLGQQQIVIRALNDNINGAYGLMGGTILGNGEPGLIIDIPTVAKHFINKNRKQEISA
jgi:two-component system chemotaxis sensor kinase CheA